MRLDRLQTGCDERRLNGDCEMAGPTEMGPMDAVREFIEGFNNDDVDRMEAACAEETWIIDDFPPHEWMARGATRRWYRDMARMASDYRMSDWSVKLDEPRHVTESDRHAYVVVPIDVRWLQDGTWQERTGSMTVALCEAAEVWRISACAWTWN